VHGPPVALAAPVNPEATAGAAQPTRVEALAVRDDRGDQQALATIRSVKALMGTKERFILAAREQMVPAVLPPAVEEAAITAAVGAAAAGAPPSSRIRQRTYTGRKEADRLATAWSSSDGKRPQVR